MWVACTHARDSHPHCCTDKVVSIRKNHRAHTHLYCCAGNLWSIRKTPAYLLWMSSPCESTCPRLCRMGLTLWRTPLLVACDWVQFRSARAPRLEWRRCMSWYAFINIYLIYRCTLVAQTLISRIDKSEEFSGTGNFLEVLQTLTRIRVPTSRTFFVGNLRWRRHIKRCQCTPQSAF